MDIIQIIKNTALYRYYHRRNEEKARKELEIRKNYFLQEGEEILHVVSEVLNSNNIVFWLEFGSLLGYYREHDFIKHDCDIDFGVFLKDSSVVRYALESVGFKLIHQYVASDGGMEECYKYKHTSIDIFYFREDGDVLYCNSFVGYYPIFINKFFNSKKCLVKRINIPNQEMIRIVFKEANVYVPIDCVKHLKMHYGETFMIPNPNFEYKKEATNIIYYRYEECKGYQHVFGSKI